jgi:6-phosphofructokinase 1
MNAAIRAVTRTAIYNGYQVKGIMRGYHGLVTGEIVEFKSQSVSNIIQKGGTILKTARSKEFRTPEGRRQAYENMKAAGIDALVVIGGDGSLSGAQIFAEEFDVPIVGLPGTIDNDVDGTDETIGYDTALNTCMEMVDKLRDTAQSHDRCSVIEVMGRHAGYLALNVGIAVGATSILVPEVPFDFERDVIARMKKTSSTGKKHFIIIVAEGIGGVVELAKRIEEETGVESRATILGHVQRGGSPTVRDRVLASRMGNRAVELLLAGKSNRVVTIQSDRITDYDIEQALAMKKPFDLDLYRTAHEISI